jgi:hypothetical protein
MGSPAGVQIRELSSTTPLNEEDSLHIAHVFGQSSGSESQGRLAKD